MGSIVVRQSTENLCNFITRALRITIPNSSRDNLKRPGRGQESKLGQADFLLGGES